ncbi:MAG TPA: Hpt domain-containing protein [Burkholderiaceae bacterium]|nr:Hpt domain-containing protein [Burkholderiaceae bacterium]
MHIDRTVFAELQESAGAEFVTELVDTFLEDAPTLLAELRSARAAADADRFRRAAHSLKSNCNTFGALALAGMARELETKGLAADAAADDAAIDAIAALYAEAAAELRDLSHG